MASEHDDISSSDLTNINMFSRNEFPQGSDGQDLLPLSIPHNRATSPPTPSITIAYIGSAQLFPAVIELGDLTENLKVVGSPHIQQAAAKRRVKDGVHKCPFRNTGSLETVGCSATFTARHNLRYHLNAHLHFKPYKCNKCSYASASPAAKKRHQMTCKGIAKKQNDIGPKQNYSPSQELADIRLTDRFYFSFSENEISHPDDSQDLPPLYIPANRAMGLPRLPPIATPSPQSSVWTPAARPPVINIDAVDDDIMAAELSRIQQEADKQWEKDLKS